MPFILSVPELLDSILRYLAKDSLCKCALVFRLWKNIAVDILWEDLTSIMPLMELVGPMKYDIFTWSFANPDHITDWEKIFHHTSRTRTLRLIETLDSFRDVLSVVTNASRLASRPAVFPKLRSIHWQPCIAGLCCIALQTVPQSLSELLLDTTNTAMGGGWSQIMMDIRNYFVYLKLRRLTIITLDMAVTYTPRLDSDLHAIVTSQRDLVALNIALLPGVCRALDVLPHLRELVMHVPSNASSWNIVDHLTRIASAHPHMQTFDVRLQGQRLCTPSVIKALFACLEIKTFKISNTNGWGPHQLETVGLAPLTEAWPALRCLEITGYELPPAILHLFSHNLQHLETLKINIIKWAVPTSTTSPTPFARLRTIDLCFNKLHPTTKPKVIADFLKKILPVKDVSMALAGEGIDAEGKFWVAVRRHMVLTKGPPKRKAAVVEPAPSATVSSAEAALSRRSSLRSSDPR